MSECTLTPVYFGTREEILPNCPQTSLSIMILHVDTLSDEILGTDSLRMTEVKQHIGLHLVIIDIADYILRASYVTIPVLLRRDTGDKRSVLILEICRKTP